MSKALFSVSTRVTEENKADVMEFLKANMNKKTSAILASSILSKTEKSICEHLMKQLSENERYEIAHVFLMSIPMICRV